MNIIPEISLENCYFQKCIDEFSEEAPALPLKSLELLCQFRSCAIYKGLANSLEGDHRGVEKLQSWPIQSKVSK